MGHVRTNSILGFTVDSTKAIHYRRKSANALASGITRLGKPETEESLETRNCFLSAHFVSFCFILPNEHRTHAPWLPGPSGWLATVLGEVGGGAGRARVRPCPSPELLEVTKCLETKADKNKLKLEVNSFILVLFSGTLPI